MFVVAHTFLFLLYCRIREGFERLWCYFCHTMHHTVQCNQILFILPLKWPLPGFTLPVLCCLSYAYSRLWRISRCTKCAFGWADTARNSQRAPLTDVYLRPGTLAAAKSAPLSGSGCVYTWDWSTQATGRRFMWEGFNMKHRHFSTFYPLDFNGMWKMYLCTRDRDVGVHLNEKSLVALYAAQGDPPKCSVITANLFSGHCTF